MASKCWPQGPLSLAFGAFDYMTPSHWFPCKDCYVCTALKAAFHIHRNPFKFPLWKPIRPEMGTSRSQRLACFSH